MLKENNRPKSVCMCFYHRGAKARSSAYILVWNQWFHSITLPLGVFLRFCHFLHQRYKLCKIIFNRCPFRFDPKKNTADSSQCMKKKNTMNNVHEWNFKTKKKHISLHLFSKTLYQKIPCLHWFTKIV